MRRLLIFLLVIPAMAQTTPHLHLNIPDYNTPNWQVLLNQNFSILDTAVGVGGGAFQTNSVPNISQILLNFTDTSNIAFTNPSGGVESADLVDTGVTPGTYTLATVTLDSKGRVLSASNGSGGGITCSGTCSNGVIPKFTGASTVANSKLSDTGTGVTYTSTFQLDTSLLFTDSSADATVGFSNAATNGLSLNLHSASNATTAGQVNITSGTATTSGNGGAQLVLAGATGSAGASITIHPGTGSGHPNGQIQLQGSVVDNSTASNTDFRGELNLSTATTATYNFTSSIGSVNHAECVVTPQFDPGSGVRYWVTYSALTSFTVNFSTAVSGNVSYICVGRN